MADLIKEDPSKFELDDFMYIIKQLPAVFIHQFFKVACYYLGYTNMEYPSPQDRSDFINENFNSINMLSKVIALTSSGKALQDEVYVNNSKANDTLKKAFRFYTKNADEVGLKYFIENTSNATDVIVKTDTVDPVKNKENELSKEIIKETLALTVPDKKKVTKIEPAQKPKEEPIPANDEPIVTEVEKKEIHEDKPVTTTTQPATLKDLRKQRQSKTSTSIKEEAPDVIETPQVKMVKSSKQPSTEKLETMDANDLMNNDKTSGIAPDVVKKTLEAQVAAEKKMEDVPDDITALDVLNTEMKLWGIDNNSFGAEAMRYIVNNYGHEEQDKYPDVLVFKLTKDLYKSKGTIVGSLKNLIKRADFDNSKYFPILSKMGKENVTYQFLIQQFIDLIYDPKN